MTLCSDCYCDYGFWKNDENPDNEDEIWDENIVRWEEENESEDESDDEESEEAWCEAGEHSVPKGMMWPGFTDCFDCATPKEYAEHMNISKKAAEAIARGEEKPMCLECEENSPLPVSSRTRSRTQATHGTKVGARLN